MEYIVVHCNTPDLTLAKQIARELVVKRAAACVNIIPAVSSIYHWDGGIQESNESMLVIKSLKINFEAIKNIIENMHPYDCPEIISFNIDSLNDNYKNFLNGYILVG